MLLLLQLVAARLFTLKEPCRSPPPPAKKQYFTMDPIAVGFVLVYDTAALPQSLALGGCRSVSRYPRTAVCIHRLPHVALSEVVQLVPRSVRLSHRTALESASVHRVQRRPTSGLVRAERRYSLFSVMTFYVRRRLCARKKDVPALDGNMTRSTHLSAA